MVSQGPITSAFQITNAVNSVTREAAAESLTRIKTQTLHRSLWGAIDGVSGVGSDAAVSSGAAVPEGSFAQLALPTSILV